MSLNDELTERLRLIHGMTPAEARERSARLCSTLAAEIAGVLNGTITPAAMRKLQREHAQEIRVLEYELRTSRRGRAAR
jgi:hypothetical protein